MNVYVSKPFTKLTDVPQLKEYLSPLMDLFNGEIIYQYPISSISH